MKTLVINCNDCFALYTFRLELLKQLKEKYKLYVIARKDDYYPLLLEAGIDIIDSSLEGSKKNLFKDLKLIFFLRKTIRKIKPDIIINYTIKPHLYGSLVSKDAKIINFVSGVGSVFLKRNLLFHLCKYFYRFIAKKVDLYIFLNNDDLELFQNLRLIKNKYEVIKGEGVHLENFYPEINFELPPTFIFIGRLVKEKGIIEYLFAAKKIKEKYPNTRFLVVGGFYDKESVVDKEYLLKFQSEGIIEYLGYSYNINEILRNVHVVVLPSYREGFSISLIEGLASKKFLITTNVAGCKDICIDGYNGFLVGPKNVEMLANAIERYILSEEKELLHENALNSSYQFNKIFYIEKMVDIVENL